MTNRYTTLFKALNLTVDYVLLNGSMIATYFLVDNRFLIWTKNRYLVTVLFFNLIWFFAANITGLYEKVLIRDSINTFKALIKSYLFFLSLISFLLLSVISFKTYFIAKEFFVYSVAIFGLLISLWKLVFLTLRKSKRYALIRKRTFVMIGAGRVGRDLFHFFNTNHESGYRLMGIFDDHPELADGLEPYVGPVNDCIRYAIANKIDEIFCALPNSEARQIANVMLEADKNLIRFKFIPEYIDFVKRPTMVENFGHIPVISLRPEPLENMLNRFIKRIFDIFFSLFVILFLFTWLFPILAVLIKLSSKGPVFFVQVRSGRDNHSFKCLKFRTMVVNAESHKKQATKNDNRITPLGAFLRRTSLDELPQFFNVLMGNMSIVGPRPHMINHTQQYSKLIDQFMVRHFLKPGITGFAQVNGLRGETKTTQAMQLRVEADVWYLENWSFLLDLKIIFLTVWNAVKGEENAY